MSQVAAVLIGSVAASVALHVVSHVGQSAKLTAAYLVFIVVAVMLLTWAIEEPA